MTELENYRPPVSTIQALHGYHREELCEKHDLHKLVRQGEFRSGLSTNEHLQLMKTLTGPEETWWILDLLE